MGKICRGNYVLISYKGDHSPRHVHVYNDGGFVVKWDLDNDLVMEGTMTGRLRKIIRQLVAEGRL